ncbi:MAG TPA: EamA family transporter [Acidisarcina sp.]
MSGSAIEKPGPAGRTTGANTPRRSSLPDPKTLLAFFAIYVIWGSTFLFIRIAVLLVPPWFAAGTRFFVAGCLLYAFMRLRGRPAPSPTQWRNLALVACLMFVITYGALFWAEQYVPSGIAAVLEATLPLITIAFEVFLLRKQPFHWKLLIGIALGFIGVTILMLRDGRQTFGIFPCLVILGGSTAWSLGAVLTRSLPLPASRGITAGAEMMLGGAVLLALSAITGELHPFPHITLKAAAALAYLIIAGSLIGFSAFVWLLGRMPATLVSSHAYINPLVAVALGYFVLAEPITRRTIVGTILVVASVALILKRKQAPADHSQQALATPDS